MELTTEQAKYLLQKFKESSTTTAHSNVWANRSYAPMYIYEAELVNIKRLIEKHFHDYVIAFDVIFESKGNLVDWHCDYESLGPFYVPNRWQALKKHSFLSIHFNLTDDGGSLTTLPWIKLSYLHYLCISTFGIFSVLHRFLVFLSMPIFILFAEKCSNKKYSGNIFDNTLLHSVSYGKPRISYVIRLVKKDVLLTKNSVLDGISRSSACLVFQKLLNIFDDSEEKLSENIDWYSVLKA